MMTDIVIVSGGEIRNSAGFAKSVASVGRRLLICCDSGARHLSAAGIIPDVLLGDMDSIDAALIAEYRRLGVTIVELPPDKDFTDTALALDYALGLKPQQVDIWGALGGRFDHALANVLLLLKGKDAGVRVRLLDEYSEMFIAGETAQFEDAAGCLVSLIALSPAVQGVTLAGFQYPLADETLSMSESRGISNIINEPVATIQVGKGNLLVMRYWKKDIFPEVL
jgi:thiamine pyrophosphokinase